MASRSVEHPLVPPRPLEEVKPSLTPTSATSPRHRITTPQMISRGEVLPSGFILHKAEVVPVFPPFRICSGFPLSILASRFCALELSLAPRPYHQLLAPNIPHRLQLGTGFGPKFRTLCR